jgi:site-specific DNA-methyltransferase (adenine-specific)
VKPYYDDPVSGITIYHGDCREILPTLKADVVVTDPPYGLGDVMHRPGLGYQWSKLWGEGAPEWDREAPTFLRELVGGFATAIVWGGNHFDLPPTRGWLVWDKIVRSFSSGHCELAWTSIEQPIRAFSYSHGQLASEGKLHPTQKPLPLMRWCLGFVPVGTILDPFMGSGTTLVAAKLEGRRAIGIEIEERYAEIAAKRLAQGVLNFDGATL